jgi:hypothetical protein
MADGGWRPPQPSIKPSRLDMADGLRGFFYRLSGVQGTLLGRPRRLYGILVRRLRIEIRPQPLNMVIRPMLVPANRFVAWWRTWLRQN